MLQQLFFRQLFLSVDEPDWWSFGSIIIYSLLNDLLFCTSRRWSPPDSMLPKGSRNEFVRIRFFFFKQMKLQPSGAIQE